MPSAASAAASSSASSATSAAPSVTVSHISSIKPSTPTPPHILYMSPIDHVLKFAPPNRTILFYATSADPLHSAASLRRAISAALVPFYPLAGRVIHDTDGRFALSCNDAGVEFIEASCSLPFSEVESSSSGGSFQIRPFFRRLVPMDDRPYSDHVGDPIVSVQITAFVGGLSVGFAISHAVVDGLSFWTFIQAISECSLGLPPSVDPIHARPLLKPATFLLNKLPDLPSDAFLHSPAPPTEVYSQSPTAENLTLLDIQPDKLVQIIVTLDKEAIRKLKEECRLHSSSGGASFSTFHVLSAYLWKRVTVARRLSEGTRVDFRVPLDVRRRMLPPLTAAFFGNAVVAVSASTNARQLVSESLAETAGRIKRVVEEGDDAYIKRAVVAREKLDLRNLTHGGVVLCNIRNASQFPVFRSSDFGWGQAAAVRPPWEGREGEITWYPGKTAGSCDVILGLSDATARAFLSSSLLRHDPLSHLFSSAASSSSSAAAA